MTVQERSSEAKPAPGGTNVKVEFKDGIAWVILNRPEKRNAMSPALNREMIEVLDALEIDDRCEVLVLTGAGDAFSAGMDLKEYFREVDKATPIEVDAGAARLRWPGSGGGCGSSPSRPSRWSTAGASAARSRRSCPAISRSPPRRRSSVSRRSTGASFRPAT